MNVTELHARADRLERELEAVREQLRREYSDPDAITAELDRTRAYAFDAALSPESLVDGCVASLDRYGFCVIDNVIPACRVEEVRGEVMAARNLVTRNERAILEAVAARREGRDAPPEDQLELRTVRRVGHPPKSPNDIVWMPHYARYLASPGVTAVARRVLDDHLRIAQLHPRMVPSLVEGKAAAGMDDATRQARAQGRGWHTDWPHDLSAYGMGDPLLNVGCMRQPFPDVAMCLVMIWYLTDVDAESGGTWVVPGSHRDPRNPRGPEDGITETAPIPGEMQVSAKAGSVYIQDSRTWHASPHHNFSSRDRVAVVNRWCPWWLSVDDFAPEEIYGIGQTGRSMSHAEYRALPAALQPLLRHLCPEERDVLQQPVLDRAAAADERSTRGYRLLRENPETLTGANAHIRVPLVDR